MDESIFTREWERGSLALRRLARSYARDLDELDELVQRTWVLAFDKRETFRGDGDFVGWLCSIGRTVCARQERRKRRERTVPLADTIRDESLPDHVSARRALARDERHEDLLNLVMSLSPRQRGLIIWHCMFGGTVKEIAEGIGRSTETVKATLKQARKKLRALEEDYERPGGGADPLEEL